MPRIGKSVDMHIQRRHEYGHLQALFLEVFGLEYLFNDHHFAIRRTDDIEVFGLCDADWVSGRIEGKRR